MLNWTGSLVASFECLDEGKKKKKRKGVRLENVNACSKYSMFYLVE